jgi:hypothetical protein
VTSLPKEDWHDREKVNEAAKANGWLEGPVGPSRVQAGPRTVQFNAITFTQQDFRASSRAQHASSPIYRAGGSTDEYDQTDDGGARGCRGRGYSLCGASEEVQAYQPPNLLSDVHVRPLSDGWSVGPAKRRLWYFRNFRWNCHCTVNRHIQLAFGRRDKRGSYLEQHHVSCSQVKGNANTPSADGIAARQLHALKQVNRLQRWTGREF